MIYYNCKVLLNKNLKKKHDFVEISILYNNPKMKNCVYKI